MSTPEDRRPHVTDPSESDRAEATPGGRGPQRPPGGDAVRDRVMTASGLNLLAGLWLIIAPFVLDYDQTQWNDVAFGIVVSVLALIRVGGAYRESWLSWVNAAIGVWLFIAAFFLYDTGQAVANDLILGTIGFFLGAASATASEGTTTWWRR